MLASQIPTKFPIPFGNNAAAGTIRTIPQASQTASSPGQASLYDGFPVATGQPLASGGIPPAMQDFNGLFNQITAWNRWQNAGATVSFDPAFSAAVGGYPAGAILASTAAGNLWLNTTDNNTTNPDGSSPSGWLPIVTGVISVPATTSTAAFALSGTQTITNNLTTQLNLGGASPTFGTFASGMLTLTKSGIYTINLTATSQISPSAQTSHATIFWIYINGQQASQQTAVNWTSVTQQVGLSNTYTSYMPVGTQISFYTYLGNSGTTDACQVNSASATITKMV